MFSRGYAFEEHRQFMIEKYSPISILYVAFLRANSLSDITWGFDVAYGENWDFEESYTLPKRLKIHLKMTEVCTEMFSIGNITFGELDGVRIIAEQNASPYLIYKRRT